jgi:acetyl-CoA synthetase
MEQALDSRVTDLISVFADTEASAAFLLCDAHPSDDIAFTVVNPDLSVASVTYGELHRRSGIVAAALRQRGITPGDRVATFMGKDLDLVSIQLGIWRLGAVYVPLFTAFAAPEARMRLEDSGTKIVVVDEEQRAKLDLSLGVCDTLLPTELVTSWQLDAPTEDHAASMGGGGALVHTFTSGTTGRPKGVVHPLSYVAGWQVYLEYAVGIEQGDVFWCAADPGWAYGLYGGIIGPLAMGRASILFTGHFDANLTWEVLSQLGVTNLCAAPTVYRALRMAGPAPAGLRLRRASSAGEPLTPDVNEWAQSELGIAVHDHFGQTELGMVIANHHEPRLARPLKPGSMGRAIPGWTVAILKEDDDDQVADKDALGRLAIDVNRSPLMTFRGYHGSEGRGDRLTADGRWYVTGDTVRTDEDGDYFFASRDDDVIIMAGYRIGPFEVESVLVQHPSVAECAVIAAPDAVRGEVVEAYVVTRDGTSSDDLAVELQQWVKTRYAAHAYPRVVHFVEGLPKTPSGKIQRRLLRQRPGDAVTTAS